MENNITTQFLTGHLLTHKVFFKSVQYGCHQCGRHWDTMLSNDFAVIDATFLGKVWDEFQYYLDVCPITNGSHFKHLWKLELLTDVSMECEQWLCLSLPYLTQRLFFFNCSLVWKMKFDVYTQLQNFYDPSPHHAPHCCYHGRSTGHCRFCIFMLFCWRLFIFTECCSWLMLLCYIWEVLGLNFCVKTGYHDWGFLQFSLVPLWKWCDSIFRQLITIGRARSAVHLRKGLILVVWDGPVQSMR